MPLSAVSVLVIVLQSPEIPEGLMNNPVCQYVDIQFLFLDKQKSEIEYFWKRILLRVTKPYYAL
jgi:hypothetical protein